MAVRFRTSSVRALSAGRAPYTRSGRTAITEPTTSPVMTASPIPISTCQVTIAAATFSTETGAVPPTREEQRERQRRDRHADQRADGRCRRDRAQPVGQHLADEDEHAPAHAHADQSHQRDVGAERRDPAVGHEEPLDEQDGAHAQHCGPRARPGRRRAPHPAGGRSCRPRRGSSSSGRRRRTSRRGPPSARYGRRVHDALPAAPTRPRRPRSHRSRPRWAHRGSRRERACSTHYVIASSWQQPSERTGRPLRERHPDPT